MACGLLLSVLGGCGQPTPPGGTAVSTGGDGAVEIRVDAAHPGPTISRHLFGQFAEHLGHGIYGGVWVGRDSPIPNTRGIRNDVVEALRALKVPNVRWPGGCFADYYHWRHGIGPRRAVTLNPDWGGVTEPNTFGTHEFMDFAEQIGAAPFISINIGSGTVQEAADWMEYMTSADPTTLARERAANGRAEPWKVPFLGLGNESWDCGGNMTPEFYADQMKMYARFARNFHPEQQEGEGRMLRIAVGPGGGEPRFTEWTETVMKAWTNRKWSWDIEGISLHNYTVINWDDKHVATGFDEQGYAEILKATLKMDGLIRQHTAIMDKYDPDKKLALVVDEWGAWYAPAPGTNPGFLSQQNSLRDAILAALNVNIFARHADRVRMANIAQMVNVLQAMILTDGPRMLLTPTYHVFRMYVPFQDATFIPVSFEAGSWTWGDITLPRIDAIAARDVDGNLVLSLTNVDPHQPAAIEVSLDGVAAGSVSGEVLTGPKVDSINTFEDPQVVVPRPLAATLEGGRLKVTLEPKSVNVLVIRP
ncbi:MAG: alpha-L-arabinofuranosidase C-terminal domain-containing protein [Pseudomonadota bacterium]|jgi:alpha-N-arabinofuranosidase|nr:MAG: alpha-N-arabinofuranosidase [Pseudomonadota bacterium]